MPTATPATEPIVRLLQLLNGSLAMYLGDSGIWSYPGQEDVKLALADIIGDQKSIVERAGAILEDRSIAPPGHGYPLSFASLHDLELAYLMPRLVESLKRQLAGIDAIIDASVDDPAAAELARDARAATTGHLDVLTQLAGRTARGPHVG
jgi:hypothetical protein